jgi:hypothetical protein
MMAGTGQSDCRNKGQFVMFYQMYELNHAAMAPMRAYADAMRLTFRNPVNPMSHTPFGRHRSPPDSSFSSAPPAATASRSSD